MPVVYTDGAINRVIEGFGTLLVVSARARQTETAALLVTAFAHALRRLGSDEHRATIVRSLDAALPAVVPYGEAPVLVEALAGLVTALEDAGLDTRATRRVRTTSGHGGAAGCSDVRASGGATVRPPRMTTRSARSGRAQRGTVVGWTRSTSWLPTCGSPSAGSCAPRGGRRTRCRRRTPRPWGSSSARAR